MKSSNGGGDTPKPWRSEAAYPGASLSVAQGRYRWNATGSDLQIAATGAVSGTLQSAETAVQRGHPDRSHVFDTGNASGGEGLLALRAGELAAEGADAARILRGLEQAA